MDWIAILNEIFQVCVIPLLAVLTGCLITAIKAKNEEIKASTDNELTKKYSDMLTQTIIDCVRATNQTYVDSLKEKEAFNKEAQMQAFKNTYESVISILSDDAKQYLYAAYGDLGTYITTKIEAEVKNNKVYYI